MERCCFYFVLILSLLLTTASALKEDISNGRRTSSCLTFPHHHQNPIPSNASGGVHMVVHHIHGPCSPLGSPPFPPSHLLHHDNYRVQALASRLTTTTLPLGSGAFLGIGNYITTIGLGTPANNYFMIIDTGSSLNWLQCTLCQTPLCHDQQGPLFNPNTSTTYTPVSCSAPACAALKNATFNPSVCSSKDGCIYQVAYGDGSFSVGSLGRDVLSLGSGDGGGHPGFVFGCGQANKGLFGRVPGLIGLARNSLSMLNQLSSKHGKTFSYCLPTSSSTGFLSIGPYNPSVFAFTPLLQDSEEANSLYLVKLVSIVVAHKPLPAAEVEFKGQWTVIDSGTVITRLPPAVYESLSQAIMAAMPDQPRAPAFSILDTCYRGSYKQLTVPEVRLVFAGGVQLKLPPQNVFYDVGKVTCLAFAKVSEITVIGNWQQRTFNVVYDVAKSKIGFAGGGCS